MPFGSSESSGGGTWIRCRKWLCESAGQVVAVSGGSSCGSQSTWFRGLWSHLGTVTRTCGAVICYSSHIVTSWGLFLGFGKLEVSSTVAPDFKSCTF